MQRAAVFLRADCSFLFSITAFPPQARLRPLADTARLGATALFAFVVENVKFRRPSGFSGGYQRQRGVERLSVVKGTRRSPPHPPPPPPPCSFCCSSSLAEVSGSSQQIVPPQEILQIKLQSGAAAENGSIAVKVVLQAPLQIYVFTRCAAVSTLWSV